MNTLKITKKQFQTLVATGVFQTAYKKMFSEMPSNYCDHISRITLGGVTFIAE